MTGLKQQFYYTEAFKHKVVQEVLEGKISKADARRKFGIPGHGTILRWIRKFEEKSTLDLPMSKEKSLSKEALIKRIKALERQLEDEKLKSEGLSKMIDIAESQLKVSIRKKSGTKQSKR
jgi:transposase-like protein